MRLITLDEAKEYGAKLPSQFQIGDFVQVNLDSYLGDGTLWVAGWVVGVKYSIKHVYYDIAVQLGNSNCCQVIENIRTFMRRLDDNMSTNFIDITQINLDDPRLE